MGSLARIEKARKNAYEDDVSSPCAGQLWAFQWWPSSIVSCHMCSAARYKFMAGDAFDVPQTR
jgi:hypothetical protein